MRRLAGLAFAAVLFAAGPVYATTPSTTPDCAEHGHDDEHNPHCDTTTTTTLLPVPVNPTTTTTGMLPTTTTTAPAMVIEPPHLDTPPATVAATTTTTAAPQVLSTHVDRLPRTGTPIGFLVIGAGLCLLGGGAALSTRRVKRGARTM